MQFDIFHDTCSVTVFYPYVFSFSQCVCSVSFFVVIHPIVLFLKYVCLLQDCKGILYFFYSEVSFKTFMLSPLSALHPLFFVYMSIKCHGFCFLVCFVFVLFLYNIDISTCHCSKKKKNVALPMGYHCHFCGKLIHHICCLLFLEYVFCYSYIYAYYYSITCNDS